nr:MAG TPA: hypothetical protein [Caudoviricetes sp.]
MNFCKITLDIYENIYIIVNVSKSKTKAPPQSYQDQRERTTQGRHRYYSTASAELQGGIL